MSHIRPFNNAQQLTTISADASRRGREWYQRLMERVALQDAAVNQAIEAIICARLYTPRVRAIGKARPAWITPAPLPTVEATKPTYYASKSAFLTKTRGRPRKPTAPDVTALAKAV